MEAAPPAGAAARAVTVRTVGALSRLHATQSAAARTTIAISARMSHRRRVRLGRPSRSMRSSRRSSAVSTGFCRFTGSSISVPYLDCGVVAGGVLSVDVHRATIVEAQQPKALAHDERTIVETAAEPGEHAAEERRVSAAPVGERAVAFSFGGRELRVHVAERHELDLGR